LFGMNAPTQRLLRHVARAGLLVLILMAVLVGSARLLLPGLAEPLRPELESWLSDLLNTPVRIRTLEARWRGGGPLFTLSGLSLEQRTPGKAGPGLDRLLVRLDVPASLFHLRPVFNAIEIHGFRLSIRVEPDGRLSVPQLNLGDLNARIDPEMALAVLQKMPEVTALGGRLRLVDSRFPDTPMLLEDTVVALRGGQRRGYRMALQATLPTARGGSLRTVLTLQPRRSDWARWEAGLFVDVEGLELARLARFAPGLRGSPAEAGLRLWGSASDGGIHGLQGRYRVEGLPGGDYRGELQWFAGGQPGALYLPRIEGPGNGGGPIGRGLWLRPMAAADGGASWGIQLAAESLDLDRASQLALASGLLPEDLGGRLQALAPRGRLERVRLHWSGSAEPSDWRFSGRGRDLQFSIGEGGDLVSGLDASAELWNGEGVALLDADQLTLESVALGLSGLELAGLRGVVLLRRSAGGLSLRSESLQTRMGQVPISARLMLSDFRETDGPFLDMQVALSDLPVDRIPELLPRGIMPPKLVAWLDHGLVSGVVRHGGLLFSGRFSDFPFRQGQGTFLTELHLEDVILDYLSDWPRAERLDARLTVRNHAMHIEAVAGEVLDVPIRRAAASIAELRRPVLKLAVEARADGSVMLDFLEQSPLRRPLAVPLRNLQASGRPMLNLSLDIPLPVSRVGVTGSLRFEDGGLQPVPGLPPLEALRGELSFTSNSLSATGLSCLWLGQELQADLNSEGQDRLQTLVLQVSGDVAPVTVMRALGREPPKLVSGSLPLQAELRVPVAGEQPLRLRAASSLEGLAVSLPAPLGKRAADFRSTRAELSWEREQGLLAVDYGPRTRILAALLGGAGGLTMERAGLRFGGGPPRLPDAPGLMVDGRLQGLVIESSGFAPPQGATLPFIISGVDLQLEQLRVGDLRIDRLHVLRRPDAWELRIADRLAEGRVRLAEPLGVGPVKAEMAYLELPELGSGDCVSRGPGPSACPGDRQLRPAALPPLDLRVAGLGWQGRELGRLQLRTRPDGVAGLELEDLLLEHDHFRLQGEGRWTATGASSITRLRLHAQASDLGETLRTLGQPVAIKGADLDSTLSLNWPGPPHVPRPELTDGSVALRIGSGRLTDVRSGGLARLLGLVNLGTLERRLRLDFGDLYKSGMSFDQVTGEFDLRGGNAYTDNLVIEAPAAVVRLEGRIGLAEQDFDQRVTVYPELSTGLPLAGVMAGGPLLGAGLLMTRPLWKGSLDKVTRQRYQLTGSWADPVLEPINPAQDPGRLYQPNQK
jgi:uncharacterized protein (TIGR02099 family)